MVTFDATTVRAWALGAVGGVHHLRAELNALNVFPVADRDTGENIWHTLRGAADAVISADPHEALREFANGALRSARGSSGVIISEALRGFASTPPQPLPGFLAAALTRAADHAYDAVLHPAEGTILTVMRTAARAFAGGDGDTRERLAHTLATARQAVVDTTDQLEVLHEAGVIDAGARGWLAVLEALDAALDPAAAAPVVPVWTGSTPATKPARDGEREWVFRWPVTRPVAHAALAQRTDITDVVIAGEDGALRVHLHLHAADAEGLAAAIGAIAAPDELHDRPLHDCHH